MLRENKKAPDNLGCPATKLYKCELTTPTPKPASLGVFVGKNNVCRLFPIPIYYGFLGNYHTLWLPFGYHPFIDLTAFRIILSTIERLRYSASATLY
jgi:hypothetical protein